MGQQNRGPKRNYKQDFQRVVAELENMILIGAFQPRKRLVEKNLSQMFNVSRFWIRDALKVLETKGLVKLIPYKGAVVSNVSLQELEEIFVIRVALEKLATRLALKNISSSDIKILKRISKQVEESFMKKDFQNMLIANTNFHDYIFKRSQNQTLQQMINGLRSRCHIIRHSAWSSPGFLERSLEEHQLYINALKGRDLETLEQLAEDHITHAKTHYLKKLANENNSVPLVRSEV